ncbi:DeoR/GlpR transcriptional regulator [Treponema parvum]|uniref:DeoR/GlpR transcriptional regulator n=1 Tax=Treponema parvum TaxID=138851 RepID=A0A975F537_9SPIR|nr:DeoR/GlpR family DNA-binding transcription regulator [Treponema parvum]QTQ14839.1 DeoR/GlpR transcriptional regulator [Treponema parvum]
MSKIESRLEQEVTYVDSNHFSTVRQLSEHIGVSEMTIRRDLEMLKKLNKINSVYGGVTSTRIQRNQNNYSLTAEQAKNWEIKNKIAQKAKELIEPKDVIFFDTGSTVLALAEQLSNENSYTCITSSLTTLAVLTMNLKKSIIITPGGVFSDKPKVFYDINAVNAIKRYRANKSFIGATGFEINLGITCYYPEDTPIKQAMLDSSEQNILLLDSSKFGCISSFQFATLEQFSTVITDTNIPDKYAQFIERSGVKLIIV